MFRKNLFVALLILTASILAWGAEDRSLTIRPKGTATERRVALVIGNSSYADAPLKNPVNDADAMVAALKETGFEVVVRKNADRRAMFSAIKEFGQKLKKSDIGLFYYAGHGVQIDSANYLLPTDLRNNDLQDADDLRRDAVALSDLMERMRDAGTRNIVILDACRDNPFLAKLSRGGSRGLAKIVTAANTSILYSTDPGNTASDGASGDNGVFTKHLVGTIRKDGLELVDVMREVSQSVDRETAGTQRPVFDGVLSTKFYFRPQQEVVAKLVEPATIGVDPKAIELRYWESAEQTRTISAYKKYLKKYPEGEFADIAIEKVQIMEAAEAKARESARGGMDQKASLADKELLAKERQEQERLAKERQEQERRVRELEAKFQQAEERARQVEEKAAKALKAQELERAAVLAQAEERARQIEERAAKALKAQEGENAAVLAAVIKREKEREQAEAERLKRERSEAERVEAERVEKERLKAEKAKKELELEQAKLKELQKEMQKGIYTDPKTGLVWLRDGYVAGYKMDWATANDWVKKQNFAGYKGWRLPTRDELMSLAKRGEKRPFAWLNANGFKNAQPAEYWTSDVNWRSGQLAVYVDLSNGEEGEFKQSFVGFHVWPVLDAKKAVATVDFEVPVSEIVKKIAVETDREVYTDLKTGLMWVRNGNLADRKMDWRQTLNWLKSVKISGYEGWRFPTRNELLSLVKSGEKQPAEWLNANGFSNVQSAEYWTADWVQRSFAVYYVDLGNGDVADINAEKYFFYVLPVLDVKMAVEQYRARPKAGAVAEKIYTDPETGLMWPQDANIVGKKLDRADAARWVGSLTYGGLNGWRLPTLAELQNIARKGGGKPFEGLKSNGFYNVMEAFYWAIDTFPWASGVSMFNGGIEKQFPGQVSNYVWPVRDAKGNKVKDMFDPSFGGGK